MFFGKKKKQDNQNIKVDILEMEKQRKEFLLKSKKFMRIEIIITPNEMPYVQIENSHIGVEEVARMLSIMDETRKNIVRECPYAGILSNFIKVESTKSYDVKPKDNKEGNK